MNPIVSILTGNSVPNTPNKPAFCEVCKEPTTKPMEFQGFKFMASVSCACERKRMAEEAEIERKQEKLRKIEKLKSLSLLSERYKDVTFENSKTGINPSFDTAFKRCKKYCELHAEVIKSGSGIYLFGDKGTGKTHLTACMANYLMNQCVPVLFTSLFEISKAVKSTFNRESAQTEQKLIENFAQGDVLFFDDLGTEIFTKNSGDTWLQSLLFDLINKRYNSQKSTIFSSNYSLNALINERGIAEKTVDRISEMTNGAVMKITGKSLRGNLKKEILF